MLGLLGTVVMGGTVVTMVTIGNVDTVGIVGSVGIVGRAGKGVDDTGVGVSGECSRTARSYFQWLKSLRYQYRCLQ